ncbi:methyltransferase domain-containing protein [Nonomuraea gerenzanensis]|uniref:Protein-L-isoaspartate O-methyltransferase n=1 Tax=Nonomuraea gerenzanensis TaxID=93944 RepID=A0A1M4E959_9ACTN|nr:methyltransferase domain-containing protein [Nonomuraea gerenzanensis]UBU17552.1 methyltransferase domain-containing protein [Nonomuraea gerenzanensis]SBO95314.1 Protein-L-isoaspartate O-methyltransferase [Nonomuraea gerenzanensis]
MDFAAQRHALVAQLRAAQDVSEPVAAAMLAVPRHLFVPGVEPEAAYRDEPIVTKLDADGRPISSSSQPAIMATMLDQLDVRPGHRVLEIGAGTGYNAALLARLVGPEGRVVALDLDEDTVEQAREHLAAAGVSGVEVLCRDGAAGHPEPAPYDRLIATVGVWDLAPAWLAQLRPDGRLVVPLDLRGVQVSAAMERDGERWVSRSVAPCGFMRMRGSFTGTEAVVVARQDPMLMLMLPEPREVGDVPAALDAAPTEITVRREEAAPPFTVAMGMALWLALHEPRWCALSGDFGSGPGFTAGVVEPGGIALLAVSGSLVARGHGEAGARLAAELAAHVRAWDEAGRPEASALRIEAHPHAPATGATPAGGGAVVIEKRHTTLVLGFG